MNSELRRTGIGAVSEVPWGSHFCLFYESPHNLLDILAAYGKAGLESNEFCLLMTSDHLGQEELMRALRAAVPDFDRHIAEEAIEIVRPEDCYSERGVFQHDHAVAYWHEKLRRALGRGFVGMRANGDAAWHGSDHWRAVAEYEQELGESITGSKMIVLCAYPLAKRSAAEMLDVARAHEFVLAKRNGAWEVLETPALKQTKQELGRLSAQLERRVAERTAALEAANARLNFEIAERREIEKELLEKESRYRSLFEASHDVIVISDSEENVLDINPRGAQITGHTLGELRAMNAVRDLVVPDDAHFVQAMLERVRQGHAQRYEVRWKTRHGEIVEFDGVTVPLPSPAGQLPPTFCSLRDITERKQIERALRESEQRFEKAFRASPLVATITRSSDARFIDVNDAFVRMYGYSRAETLGRTALELNLWAEPAERIRFMAELDRAGSVKGYEARFRAKSGRILDVVLFLERIEIAGEQCLLISTYDQTARKQGEDALRRASDELKALSRRLVDVQEAERRELSRELHDRIGQNLTALGINLDIVRSRLRTADAEIASRLEDSIALLEATADATVNLLSELRPPMLDDLGLVVALDWYGKEFAARTGIDVSVTGEDVVPELEPQVTIALFRIVQEALNNVAKHAAARHVDIELTSADGEWMLRVSDDGVGLGAGAFGGHAVGGFGIATMRERSLAIGARFDVLPRTGGGTAVLIRGPSV